MAENIPQQAEQPSKEGKRKIIRVMAKTIDIELQNSWTSHRHGSASIFLHAYAM